MNTRLAQAKGTNLGTHLRGSIAENCMEKEGRRNGWTAIAENSETKLVCVHATVGSHSNGVRYSSHHHNHLLDRRRCNDPPCDDCPFLGESALLVSYPTEVRREQPFVSAMVAYQTEE